MTSYNREKYIGEAIESVLSSTYENFELIIVDDQSRDKTVDIARSYEAKDPRICVYINERNLGDYANRNQAASLANGKYLKYVDSDDYIFSNTLETMVSLMEEYPDAAFGVSSRTEDKTKYFSPSEAYHCHFFQRGLLDYGPTGTIIRRDIFEAAGRFKTIRNVSDFDLWLRLALKYGVVEMPKGLVFWRQHEGQEINIAPEYYLEYSLPIIKEALNHKDCPLKKEEIGVVLSRWKKDTARTVVKGVLRGKIGAGYKLWKRHELTFADLF